MVDNKTIKLKEYASVTMGQSPSSDNFSENGVPFLQGNRTFGEKYPTYDTFTESVTRLAKAGDVVFSVRAPVGEVNILKQDTCIGRGLCGLNSIDEDNEFLYYLMEHESRRIRNLETGSVFGSINRKNLESFMINLPSINTRREIAKILSTFDNLIETNSRINDYLIAS